VQNLSYVWDTAGNLTRRRELRQSSTDDWSGDFKQRVRIPICNHQQRASRA